jgi:C-terminal processing protease CtpA/Prc
VPYWVWFLKKQRKALRSYLLKKKAAAEKAGLKKDDIITKVNDTKIESSSDLYDAIGKFKPAEQSSHQLPPRWQKASHCNS